MGCPNPATDPEQVGVGAIRLLGRQVIEELLPPEVIRLAHARIAEGLDATSQKVFQREGEVIYSKPLVDWTERREYAREVLKLADHYPTHEAGEGITVHVQVAGVDLGRMVGAYDSSVDTQPLEPSEPILDVVADTSEPAGALSGRARMDTSGNGDRGQEPGIPANTEQAPDRGFSETLVKTEPVQKRQRSRVNRRRVS